VTAPNETDPPLLDHGVDVERVAPVRSTLEERFLTMTTRLEDRS
jgi:hypothetical protein